MNENLIPFNERTEEEVRAIAKKGGINSGKARKEKAELKKTLLTLLESDFDVESSASIPVFNISNSSSTLLQLVGIIILMGLTPGTNSDSIKSLVGSAIFGTALHFQTPTAPGSDGPFFMNSFFRFPKRFGISSFS